LRKHKTTIEHIKKLYQSIFKVASTFNKYPSPQFILSLHAENNDGSDTE